MSTRNRGKQDTTILTTELASCHPLRNRSKYNQMDKFYLLLRRKFILTLQLIRTGNWSEFGQKLYRNIRSVLSPVLEISELVHDLTVNRYWHWANRSSNRIPYSQSFSPGFVADDASQSKNVIWIMLDALRQDLFDAYLKRGGFGELVGDAVYFPRAFAQGSWTYPSVFSFLTGRYPFNCGVSKLMCEESQMASFCTDFDDACPTIFSILRERGYQVGSILDGWGFTVRNTAAQKHREDRYFEENWGWIYGQGRRNLNLEELKEATLSYVSRSFPQGPFMLFVRSLYTHSPYRGIFRSPEYVNNLSRKRWAFRIIEGFNRGLRKFEEGYLNPLMLALADISSLENTVIILCSDHGDMFWNLEDDLRTAPNVEEEMWRHQLEPYNALVKVPLLIWGTGMRGVYPHRFRLMDVLPTLIEVLEFEFDLSEFDGIPLNRTGSRQLYADSAGYGFGGVALQSNSEKILISRRIGVSSYHINEDEYERLDLRRDDADGIEEITRFVKANSRTADTITEHMDDQALLRRLQALGYL